VLSLRRWTAMKAVLPNPAARWWIRAMWWTSLRPCPRYKKPIGIYWLQAAATELGGAVGRRPGRPHLDVSPAALLGAIAASWLTVWWCALAMAEAEAAFLAGLLMLVLSC